MTALALLLGIAAIVVWAVLRAHDIGSDTDGYRQPYNHGGEV